jgi:formiminotetrahydrofolate cyclodeaminase
LSDSVKPEEYPDETLGRFLELISEPTPAPAAGSGIAVTIGIAAALCAKTARLSTRHAPDATEIAHSAVELRNRALQLCQLDAQTFLLLLLARRESSKQSSAVTDAKVHAAQRETDGVLLELTNVAVEIGEIATRLVEVGNPNLIGDALTATLLAESGARSAVALIIVNTQANATDAQVLELRGLLARAESSATHAQHDAFQRLSNHFIGR